MQHGYLFEEYVFLALVDVSHILTNSRVEYLHLHVTSVPTFFNKHFLILPFHFGHVT